MPLLDTFFGEKIDFLSVIFGKNANGHKFWGVILEK